MRNRGSSSSFSSSSSSTDTDCSSVSTLYTNSMASISSSNCSSSSIDYETRCEGLDLLVKAVVHVAGCFLVVPFTQRRVIRRRKRNLSLSFVTDFIKNQEKEIHEEDEDEEEVEIEEKKQKRKKKGKQTKKVISKPKRKKRVMAVPSKYNDSVLHPWVRTTRKRQSIEEST